MFVFQHKLSLLLSVMMLSCFLLIAEDEDYSSGRARIEKIMTQEETGIAAYNKSHIHFADTKNIEKDLNTPAIASYFGCKTLIGQSFMSETLICPVSRQDKDTVLANRQ